jgi:hypothetical protein
VVLLRGRLSPPLFNEHNVDVTLGVQSRYTKFFFGVTAIRILDTQMFVLSSLREDWYMYIHALYEFE